MIYVYKCPVCQATVRTESTEPPVCHGDRMYLKEWYLNESMYNIAKGLV